MTTKVSTLPVVSDQEDKYLLTLTSMFDTIPPAELLACLRKHKGSMEDAITELLATSRKVDQKPATKTPVGYTPLSPMPSPSPSPSPAPFTATPLSPMPSLTTAYPSDMGASTTLTRMKEDLQKVYENSIVSLEAELRQEKENARKFAQMVADREMLISQLQKDLKACQADLTKSKEEITQVKGLLEVRETSAQIAEEMRKKVDIVIAGLKCDVDPSSVRYVANLVRQDMARALLKDIQEPGTPSAGVSNTGDKITNIQVTTYNNTHHPNPHAVRHPSPAVPPAIPPTGFGTVPQFPYYNQFVPSTGSFPNPFPQPSAPH